MKQKTKNCLIATLSTLAISLGAFGWVNTTTIQNVASAEAASSTVISLVEGAACRIRTADDEEQGSGIRFKAVLDRTQWTALAASNEMVAGIMILPTDYINVADGYTHEALDAAGKKYLDFTFTEEEVGEKSLLAASMVDILDQNYTRDFSGVAYLKSTTAFEGATEYNGAYYSYAEYTEEDNSRSIYEIAFAAYNDRSASKVTTDYENAVVFNENTSYSPYTDGQRNVLKGYLDGVVDLKKNAYADIVVANNTQYYTSPYTIKKESNADFVVNYALSVEAKGMLFNGERIKELAFTDGKANVSLTDRVVLSENAAINADGSVTLGGRTTPGGYAYHIAQMDNSYIALEGTYGLGTYIDISFKGNNMPEVMFFADQINGNMTSMGGKGVLFSNGIANASMNQDFLRKYYIFGPNRISLTGGITDSDKQAIATNWYETSGSRVIDNANKLLIGYNSSGVASDYPFLTQKGLASTPDTEYKYTVGMYESNGKVYAHIKLYDATNHKMLYNFDQATTLSASNLTAGSIILYGTVAGEANSTTFTYSAPYSVNEVSAPNNGATANTDGSVTLAGKVSPGSYVYHVAQLENSYVAVEGEYGLNTYIDIMFKGNNMPQVMFFADQINGNMTSMGGKGVLFSNGLTWANGSVLRKYAIYGPNRIYLHGGITDSDKVVQNTNTYEGSDSRVISNTNKILLGYDASGNVSDYPYLTQKGLATTPDIMYKYTLGMYEKNSVVYAHIELHDITNGVTVYNFDQATTLSASNLTAGNIILYGSVAGTATTTTFSYSEPYTQGDEIEEPEETPEVELPANSGATFNDDGSVTLAGKASPGGYVYHVAQVDNSYVALEGEYGLDTYIDITFKGNNMPQVLFFADQINGNMTSMGGKGVLFSNGLVTANPAGSILRKYAIYGPNRIYLYGGITDSDKVVQNTNTYEGSDSRVINNANRILLGYDASGNVSSYPYLTQKGLATTPDVEYRYILGMYENDGVVYAHIELYDLTNGATVYNINQATTLSASDLTAGSIILYGSVAGAATTTTFSYSEPYLDTGVTSNDDGSITLAGGESTSAGWMSGISESLNNSYFAFDGEYTIGTEVAFTFTGNNLPQVMLFADQINGDMSKLGGKGILLMNGLYVSNPPSGTSERYIGKNKLVCFGPNRIYDNYYTLVVQQDVCDVTFEDGYAWAELEDGVSYKYVVWTEEVEGEILVCVELYNAITLELLSKGSYDSNVSVNDITAGAIVVYAAVKGDGRNTTFFYDEPVMHAEKMEFYTYGTPGTYATEADLTTEEVLTDYLNSGMTTMVLSGESAFNGIGWSSSKTKALMDKAIAVGVEKFIINDTRLNDGLCIEGSLIGTGCKFASEAELDRYVENCITDYVNEKEFYGLILKDEPGYTYATSMGQLYRSIKRVAEKLNVEIYVQMNLHPLSDDAWDYYKATATSSMYEDYKDYLRLFLDGTGADMICVDKYPFMADGEFLPDYYACYKALAEVCAEYNAQFGFVLQSWTDTSVRTVSQEEMNLQMNAALAFGAKELSFFSYVPRDDGENESQSFIDINGNKTAVYDYAKNAIASAKQVANLLCDYDYVGSSTNDKSQESWFVDDTFAKLTYTSASWSVVTESYNDKTDSYLYTVINANVDTTAASTITLTFAGATQAYVLEDGVWSLVNLANGTYTANVSLGEAIYIIPLA